MDLSNPIIKLCVEGARAEFEGRPDDARFLYNQAWDAARDDYEACIAAHYVARLQETPEKKLHWNLEALNRAEAVSDVRVNGFYPFLYLNLGQSYEQLGDQEEAARFYDLAAGLGFEPQAD